MRALRNQFRRRPKDAGGEQWRGNLVKHNDMNDAYDTLGGRAMRERLPNEYIWLSDCTTWLLPTLPTASTSFFALYPAPIRYIQARILNGA